MDSLKIIGGNPIKGQIKISGAKNAALPLMACGLLFNKGTLTLSSMPNLADTKFMCLLLKSLGIKADIKNNVAYFKGEPTEYIAQYDIVRKMRASILVLGPLLTRLGVAKVSLPGGCSIGTRPVDLHINALEKMGAKIELANGYIEARAPKKGLIGSEIYFPKISVGATENTIMAASLARGRTKIINAAKEPEIIDLAKCLISMGAKISGAGTDEITIDGVEELSGCDHRVIPDRIEAGSFAIAASITGGELELIECDPMHLLSLSKLLINAGVNWENTGKTIKISSDGNIKPISVETSEYPGFPTDLQAQFMTLMTIAKGNSKIVENIFENRFMHVPELTRMGAKISLEGGIANVVGVNNLNGARLMATDLRASISLVIAALKAKGESIISRIYHLDRGYENIEKKLINCGANIQRFKE
ncbi:MAG: UDP-N-acetylglucosamine 1-carboxyvinyltransferase [SAR116 cluster bacterium]|nr:UDP-N-acetylglucosamine 1-carboxyvinyltransferase [SAR116 cluster bacterium]